MTTNGGSAPTPWTTRYPSSFRSRVIHGHPYVPVGWPEGISPPGRPTRWHDLDTELTDLDVRLAALANQARPDLLAITGIGVETAAQVLSTCGDNPDRL